MPDDPDLLTIGDFARAVGLPASALRHDDECGLLVPARTDASTGYRYSTPALERRARLVALMRDVGVPIDTMRLVLDGTARQARGVLDGVAAEREQQAHRTRTALETVLTVSWRRSTVRSAPGSASTDPRAAREVRRPRRRC